MLVEDPRDTIKTLCQFSSTSFNWHSFKENYERIKGLVKPISSQHTDTHFYSLSIYGLIKPSESAAKGEYQLSAVGKVLCQSLAEGRINDYKRILSNLLINNSKKGLLFREFINFVKARSKASNDDVIKLVEGISAKKESKNTIGIIARTIIAWSEDAGLIGRDKERKIIWFVAQEPEQELTIDQFWQILLKKYKYLRQSEIFGIEHIYVDILELRTIVCIELSWPIEKFDSYLVKLLDSEMGERVRLYGAPTSFFSDKQNFSYMERVYAYIMIKV
jgi:hypothetical protein